MRLHHVISMLLAACFALGPIAGAASATNGGIAIAIVTDRGRIEAVLDPVHAPVTTKNFLRYVDRGFYTGGTFFPDYSLGNGLTAENLGHKDGTYQYATYKQDVEDALVAFFGRGHVTRGNKAFDIHENTYRIDADVVPAFEHRRYLGTPQNHHYITGTELHPDAGGTIVNWPQQNYDNGVAKNNATNRGFKGVVRILKRLRNEMADCKIEAATPIPSYLIECLVWNVLNQCLTNPTWDADVRQTILYLWQHTGTDDACKEWGEINENKYLFRNSQPWTRAAVRDFLQAAWEYLGFA